MDLSTLKERLLPCDISHPFAFVSYSAVDTEIVFQDVLTFQTHGYNIWIDEANFDKSKDSWYNDVRNVIEDYNCSIVIFYISSHSLTSPQCLKELEMLRADETKKTHLMEAVRFIAIETENIDNYDAYIKKIRDEVERSTSDNVERNQRIKALTIITNDYLTDNQKLRIHAKKDPKRLGNYYFDIEKELDRSRKGRVNNLKIPHNILIKTMPVRVLYRYGIECIINRDFSNAQDAFRKNSEEDDIISVLMLSHLLYENGDEFSDGRLTAKKIWETVDKLTDSSQWRIEGNNCLHKKQYSEALAYLLAYADRFSNGRSMFEAAKAWLAKGSKFQVEKALKCSIRFGYDEAQKFLTGFACYSADQVRINAFNDEAFF